VGVLIWLAWAGILTFHAIKYRFPNDKTNLFLLIFWGGSIFILILSIVFILKADWITVPAFFKSM
jgi:hypothetical protein